ncbi:MULTISPECIES: ABC transporter ATP-binding protein [Providencia]|uniref:ATP-binding component of ABC transporter n=1 Tax=Providencia stuartii (strain MRSN 2154) TaxID=1157951 RepID=A0A140NNN9_PROSM|nr:MULTISPECIES: ABC transporter ATP-binding protein [Providencia]AFH93572.1 ATP-binding component of ABC transporter [Providencia stuartii MRSN 2154]AMG68056.1 ABC transporter ATP-binding protein [Providencia stuartii]MDE8747583.1 ABC transporter ATP-binding protein [Providencia thailandensis]MDE8766589.1 ABC transporter ATP-binding protein [Providencia thailandensis]MDE8780242.1 ABC transporter ATP-binding protein [Providencia thailandensis]
MSYVIAENLSKSFGQNQVFSNIQFTIEKGEFITLLGPSGCGKSTLLRCIAGLEQPDNGDLYINRQNITHQAAQQRGVGMVFQSYALFPNMTVEDNIAFGLKMRKVNSTERNKAVADVIEMVELQGKEQQFPHQLSGGQRQRVALARALVMKPQILLLDEPLSALDARIRKHLRQQIRHIQRELKLTTIFVTHDQDEAMIMSDRIFLMNKGAIIQNDTAENIYTQPANEFVARFMGNYNLVEADKANALLGLNLQGTLAIRPESIYVKEAGRHYGEHISQPVDAIILDHQLLGNIIRYSVNTAAGNMTVDLLNRSSERLFEPGTRLELMFNKNEIRALS